MVIVREGERVNLASATSTQCIDILCQREKEAQREAESNNSISTEQEDGNDEFEYDVCQRQTGSVRATVHITIYCALNAADGGSAAQCGNGVKHNELRSGNGSLFSTREMLITAKNS